MEKITKYIIGLLLLIGGVSCLYFLSILWGIPFIVPLLLAAGFGYFLYQWFLKNSSNTVVDKISWVVAGIFVICLFLFAKNILGVATKHGGWDAWAIWNLHTRYLVDAHNWKNMFLNTDTEHPDYPLCLPAFLAFLCRLTANHYPLVITFYFFVILTISCPLLIWSELTKKNSVVALFTFFLMAQDQFYIGCAVSEYADILVALFFLAALVCINYAQTSPKYIAICSALLLCCAWTKNEGAILAAIFFLFYANLFFNKQTILYTIAGATLPLIALLLFKISCPTPNDMVSSLNKATLHRFIEKDRYNMIYDIFMQNVNKSFYYIKIGVYLSIIIALIRKEWLSKQFLLLLTCLIVYLGIFVATPHDLEWQLNTALARLLLQLMPAVIYVVALQMSRVKFELV